jgi:transposase
MLGKKDYQEKLFVSFHLSQRIPKDNFYRKLRECLSLDFLYKEVKPYYGSEGQKSIDPKVFFKIMLVGYLENIISDRSLIEHIGMRLDLLYFIGYDIDDSLPWHSTISRTRKKLPTGLFESLFDMVLRLCINAGMVSGNTQAVDAAYVKANASLDSLVSKTPSVTVKEHIQKVIQENDSFPEKDKHTKETPGWKKKEVEQRHKRQQQQFKGQPGSNKGKYLSNHTHYSPTDPEARIAVKPGKPRQMYYLSNMGVDTSNHVITHMESDYADLKDSQTLIGFLDNMLPRMKKHGLVVDELLADAGYNSGANLKYIEGKGITGYIPPHGQYERIKPGFTFDKENNRYICRNNKYLVYKKTMPDAKGNYFMHYSTCVADCRDCHFAKGCKGKANERRLRVTVYKEYHDRMEERMLTKQGRKMRKLRMATVEPVFGTLINHLGMRKINTKGIKNAHKCMLMAAMAYNLKKYLKYIHKNCGRDMMRLQLPLPTLLNIFYYNLFRQIPLPFRLSFQSW